MTIMPALGMTYARVEAVLAQPSRASPANPATAMAAASGQDFASSRDSATTGTIPTQVHLSARYSTSESFLAHLSVVSILLLVKYYSVIGLAQSS